MYWEVINLVFNAFPKVRKGGGNNFTGLSFFHWRSSSWHSSWQMKGLSFSRLSLSIFTFNLICSAAVCLWVPFCLSPAQPPSKPPLDHEVFTFCFCHFGYFWQSQGPVCEKIAKCVYLSCHPYLLWLQVDSGGVFKWISEVAGSCSNSCLTELHRLPSAGPGPTTCLLLPTVSVETGGGEGIW